MKVKQSLLVTMLAGVLIAVMGIVMILSVLDDTYTTDELLYLPTGYMYLTEQTMRLGFEHPPLVRDLAALPLLFMKLKPASEFWDTSISGASLNDAVWDFGENFLFNQTHSVEKILFWGRLPMIIVTLFLGFLVFLWTRRKWGDGSGLLALLLFSASPLILGHGRLVTMDVAAALGAFASTYYFVRFLKNPSIKTSIIAGVLLGIAQLIKFSLLLLVPFFGIIFIVWVILQNKILKNIFASVIRYLPKLALVALVSVVLIALVYQFHIWNYPKEQQMQDMQEVLASVRPQLYEKISWFPKLTQVTGLRPLVQYSFGVLWQYSRSGAFAYFHGEGSGTGFRLFYPIGYFIKEPLAFHFLTILGLWFVARRMWGKPAQHNFFAISAGLWIAFYWLIMVAFNPINTGIRYLVPTLPFLYFLIAGGIGWWLRERRKSEFSFRQTLIGGLIGWQIISVASVHPSFLAYFNESIGGPEQGYQYLVDTDLEWGQNVKRLAEWVMEKGIEQIAVPYELLVTWDKYPDPVKYAVYNNSYPYYLGNRYRYLPPDTPTRGWIAIPAHLLQWGRAVPTGHNGWSSDSYRWLDAYEPVAKIGYSIFVYYIPDTT